MLRFRFSLIVIRRRFTITCLTDTLAAVKARLSAMAVRLLVPLLALTVVDAQQINLVQGEGFCESTRSLSLLGIAHPAAGPDFGQHELARSILPGDDLLSEDFSDGTPALVGPEGQHVIMSLKEQKLRYVSMRISINFGALS